MATSQVFLRGKRNRHIQDGAVEGGGFCMLKVGVSRGVVTLLLDLLSAKVADGLY